MARYLVAVLVVGVYLVAVAAQLRDPQSPIPSGLAPMALLSLGFILGRSITAALGVSLRDVLRGWLITDTEKKKSDNGPPARD